MPRSPGLPAPAELGMTALQSIHTECDVHGTKLLQASGWLGTVT